LSQDYYSGKAGIHKKLIDRKIKKVFSKVNISIKKTSIRGIEESHMEVRGSPFIEGSEIRLI